MARYEVLGEGWCDMYSSDTQADCRQWFDNYTWQGDWGGWIWFVMVDTETEETLEAWERIDA